MKLLAATVMGVCGFAMFASPGFAQEQPNGFLHPEKHARQREALKHRADIESSDVLRPLYKAERVAHVANGVALRDRVRGFVHARGVPANSEIVASFLLWNFSDDQREGAQQSVVLFDGNVVPGRKTADNTDPCWGRAGNHSYIANVTAFTNRTGGANQEYEVTMPFTARTSSGGGNPWGGAARSDVFFEGASLVIIYRNDNTTGGLYLFAPPGDNMFFNSATYLLPSPGQGRGQLTMVGADGQRGFGHDNFASNELTFFDGSQIAGPSVAASDWDGSDGLTLPQLWDTHTHLVTLSGGVSKLTYDAGSDCLVPVGFVLDAD